MKLRSTMLVAWLLFPSGAWAHGTLKAVATPLLPSREFIWLPLFFFGVVGFLLRRSLPKPVLRPLLWKMAISAYGLMVVLVLIADFASSGYSPLFIPLRTFWGCRSTQDLIGFLLVNAFVLLVILLLFSRISRSAPGRVVLSRVVVSACVAYLVCEGILLLSGAWYHGMPRGYSRSAELRSLGNIRTELKQHLQTQGGFPEAREYTKVWAEIRSHAEQPDYYPEEEMLYPSFARLLYRHPRPWIWNEELSGKSLAQLRKMPHDTLVLQHPYDYYWAKEETNSPYRLRANNIQLRDILPGAAMP